MKPRHLAWTGQLRPACDCKPEAREDGGKVECVTCGKAYVPVRVDGTRSPLTAQGTV
jgi:hypothetical protein